MINLNSGVKQSGKVCAACRSTFYKIIKSCDFCDNPGADANELQKIAQEESHSFSEAMDIDASHFAVDEILNSSQPSVWETPINSNAH